MDVDKHELTEIRELFLLIGDALMSIGTKRNMTEDWYAMVEKYIDKGVDMVYNLEKGG